MTRADELRLVDINALGEPPVTLTRAGIVVHDRQEICRVDAAASQAAVRAKASKAAQVFYVRMNNSSRQLPDDEVETFVKERLSWTIPPL